MKKFIFVLMAIPFTLLTYSNVSAAGNSTYFVKNAYSKGKGQYDVVVKAPKKEKLQLYVNDSNPVKAKTNNEGWATFKKVEISGQAKLSLAKKANFKYKPINYVKYIQVNDDQVSLISNAPKYSFEEFANWLGDGVQQKKSPNGSSAEDRRFNLMRTKCNVNTVGSDADWVTCMQGEYKDYLKPEAFAGGPSVSPMLVFVGSVNQYDRIGIQDTETINAKKEIESLRATYYQYAVTKQ